MKGCELCVFYRPASSRCTRDMTMQDGRVIKQASSGRSAVDERNGRATIWQKIKRRTSDICGKTAKHRQVRA